VSETIPQRGPALVIATTNPGKLREVRAVLAGVGVKLLSLSDFPAIDPPDEHGATFEEIAEGKALYYARKTGHWTLADDSGLEVDALNGAPGVHSARYAGPDGDDAANNAKLIRALAGIPPERRSARFRCAVALSDGKQTLATASGVIEGQVIDEPRGTNGFGYDPHFFVPEFAMTTAQMPPEQKNRISHRGRALAAISPRISKLVASLDPSASL
jgi:XTP/dITP diphosphohydrolase